MREDMNKVIVERPRTGGGGKYPRAGRDRQRIALEERPRTEGMRRPWAGGGKSLNENLSPLRRYLASNVGRPWDKVYSEISAHVDRSNAVQAHIWQHIEQYVCVKAEVIDGRVIDLGNRRSWTHWQPELYVDPRTGILRRKKRWRAWRAPSEPPPAPMHPVGENRVARRVDGVWYEIELRPYDERRLAAFDVVLKKDASALNQGELQRTYGTAVYAVSKRQLGKREIRRIVGAAMVRPLPNISR
jgi:hypothetical protein